MSQYKGMEFLILSQERQKYLLLCERKWAREYVHTTCWLVFFIWFCVLTARSVLRLSQPLSRFRRWLATFLRQGIGRARHYIKAKLAGVGDTVEALDERSGRSVPSRLFGPNGCGMSSSWHSSKSNSSQRLTAWESTKIGGGAIYSSEARIRKKVVIASVMESTQ